MGNQVQLAKNSIGPRWLPRARTTQIRKHRTEGKGERIGVSAYCWVVGTGPNGEATSAAQSARGAVRRDAKTLSARADTPLRRHADTFPFQPP